jgi:hypothetical protein
MLHFFQRLPFEQGTPRTACGKLKYAIIEDENDLSANLIEPNGEHFCRLHPLWQRGASDVKGLQDACQLHYEREMWDTLSPEIQSLIKQHYPQECAIRGIDNGEL